MNIEAAIEFLELYGHRIEPLKSGKYQCHWVSGLSQILTANELTKTAEDISYNENPI